MILHLFLSLYHTIFILAIPDKLYDLPDGVSAFPDGDRVANATPWRHDVTCRELKGS